MLEQNLSRNWFALVPIWGKDNQLKEQLEDLNVLAFSPMYISWRKVNKHRRNKIGKSKELIKTMLTPGYVFARILSNEDIVKVESCRYFHSFVKFGETVSAIRDSQFENFQDKVYSGFYNEGKLNTGIDLQKGYSVSELLSFIGQDARIVSGPFEDRAGKIIGVKGQNLLLDGIVKLEVSANDVEIERTSQDPDHL